MAKNYLAPNEITEYTISGGAAKVNRSNMAVFLMAIMAGIYVSLGAIASSTAAHSVTNAGVAKLITGAVFPIGIMLVVINGADLFTGNCLIIMSTYDKKTSVTEFLKNLSIVLVGNFVGAVFMAFMQANSGLFSMNDGAFVEYVFKIAYGKVTLTFTEALVSAVLCNIFVCAGILMMYGAKDVTGKILAGFFSIFAFGISGVEHIVANMYYLPSAIFAKGNASLVEMSGFPAEKLEMITWSNFFVNNAIPVVIGNILGGILVGTMYYLIYKKFTKPVV